MRGCSEHPGAGMNYAELTALVGEQAALELSRACGGHRMYVPHPPRQGRDKKMVEDYRRGMGYEALAAAYGLSQRRVRQIVGKARLQ